MSGATILAALLLAGAHGGEPPTDWRRVVTTHDRKRLHDWRDDWLRSLAAAKAGDGGAAIAADPVLFDPDDGLDRPTPPAGAYRCRVVKFAAGHLDAGPWSRCQVSAAGALVRLERLDGVQRFDGLVYADGTHRSIFLGTASYPEERRPIGYAHASGRDMIGLVERIAPQRWRMALPRPQYESQFDLVEFAPAA